MWEFLLCLSSFFFKKVLLPPPPPLELQWFGLKLVCNVKIVYGNLKFENSQDYAQKSQGNCTFMNSASGQIALDVLYFLYFKDRWACPVGVPRWRAPWACPRGRAPVGVPPWACPHGRAPMGVPPWACPVDVPRGRAPWAYPVDVPRGRAPWAYPVGVPRGRTPWACPVGVPRGRAQGISQDSRYCKRQISGHYRT